MMKMPILLMCFNLENTTQLSFGSRQYTLSLYITLLDCKMYKTLKNTVFSNCISLFHSEREKISIAKDIRTSVGSFCSSWNWNELKETFYDEI